MGTFWGSFNGTLTIELCVLREIVEGAFVYQYVS